MSVGEIVLHAPALTGAHPFLMTTGAPSAFPPVRRSVALHFMDVLPAGACAVLPTLTQSRTPQVQSDQAYSQEGDLYPTAGI